MKLNKHLAKHLSKIASKQAGRYAMNEVDLATDPVDEIWEDLRMDADTRKDHGVIQATDGRVLMIAAVPTEPEDMPGLISTAVLKAAAKSGTKARTDSTVDLSVNDAGLATVNDGVAATTLPRSEFEGDGQFPRIAAVIHPERHPIRCTVNGHYLAKIVSAVADLSGSGNSGVELSFELDADGLKPVRVQPVNGENACVGYVMPLTVDRPKSEEPIASMALRNCLYALAAATTSEAFAAAQSAVADCLNRRARR